MAWRIGVALGLIAGVVQIMFALYRPTEPPLATASIGGSPEEDGVVADELPLRVVEDDRL